MRGADLDDANLNWVNFEGARLVSASLRRTMLVAVNLKNANLHKAQLQDANLERSDLTGADMSKTNLSETDLNQAKLIDTNLSGADVEKSFMYQTDLSGAYLESELINANNIYHCPSTLPEGWRCSNTTLLGLIEGEINIDLITVESLRYSVDCPSIDKNLKIKLNKKEKFVVRFAGGKRFYRGLDFDEALEVFEETYEDKCVE